MRTDHTSYLKGLLHLIFPDLCLACRSEIPVLNGIFCIKCLLTLPFTKQELNSQNTFTKHFKSRDSITGGTALFYLNRGSGVEKMLHQLKYSNRPDIGEKLGSLYGHILKESAGCTSFDAIVPVPLHPKKKAARGFNQSEQIATGIGKKTGIPVRTDLLFRTTYTKTQTTMNRTERIKNTENAFCASDVLSQKIFRLMLVDDVLTTGATFEGCIHALFQKNEKTEIHLLTIAMGNIL